MPMMSLRNRFRYSAFYRIFNCKDALGKGRCVLLVNTFLANIANIFVSGVFNTAFLALHGIDIVRVGIIAFIPYIAGALSLLSPMIVARFKRRRGILLFNHIFFYLCTVLATTIMPLFVEGNGQRTLWFGIFNFIAHAVNALLGNGSAAWHIRFVPEGEDRNTYLAYHNLLGALVSTAVAVVSSLVADSLAGSPQQGQIINILRYVALAVFVISGLQLYLIPKEFPYPQTGTRIRLLDIFTVPIRARKFMLTALIVMMWNFTGNLNSSTWTYFALNTIKVNYMTTYTFMVVYTLGFTLLMNPWRRLINRYSWHRVLFYIVVILALMEFFIAFATPTTHWVYITVSIIQGTVSVGHTLVFASLFYIHLPKDANTDLFNTFWSLASNMSVLAGSVLGTWFLSLLEPHGPWNLFGLPFYGSQFLVWIKCVLFLGVSVYLRAVTPHIREEE